MIPPRIHHLLGNRLHLAARDGISMIRARRARRSGEAGFSVAGLTTDPASVSAASPARRPNDLWVADLTAIETDRGLLYVAAVLDSYTRHCLGWRCRSEPRPELVIEAAEQAASRSWPSVVVALDRTRTGRDIPLLLSARCRLAAVAVPPSSAASALDGAAPESFFSIMRRDLIDAHPWPTRTDAAEAVDRWIEHYYNPYGSALSPASAAIGGALDQLSP